MSGGGRFVGLDLLRIFLAFLIFLFHSHTHLGCDYYFLNDFIRMGAIAMTGFFMLSGYCLCISNIKTDLSKYDEVILFYKKRIISILPLYYFVASLYVILKCIDEPGSVFENLVLLPVETLCLQTVFSSLFNVSHNGGSWFVSCIIICYALFPFIQTLLTRFSDRKKVVLMLVLICFLLYSPFVEHIFGCNPIYSNPFFRMLEFIIGAILGLLNHSSNREGAVLKVLRTWYSSFAFFLILIIGITIAKRIGLPMDYMLYNWIALPCFIGLILSLGYIKMHGYAMTLYLSKITYAFFMVQVLPFFDFFSKGISNGYMSSNIIRIFLPFTCCLLFAIILHEVIEKPIGAYLINKYIAKSRYE